MKRLLQGIVFVFVIGLFALLSIKHLSIATCDRLFLFTLENEFQESLSLQCLCSDSLEGKGWLIFESPSYTPPVPISYFANNTNVTTDLSNFPVGDYRVQLMTYTDRKAVVSNWIHFSVTSEAPHLWLSDDMSTPLYHKETTCTFTCISSQPLREAYFTLHNQRYSLHPNSSQEWTFHGDLPLQNGRNTLLIHGTNHHHVANQLPIDIVYKKPTTAQQVVVLGYHNIGTYKQEWVVFPETFEHHIQYLHDNGYYFCTPSEVLLFNKHKISLPEKSVLITFDDGCSGVFTHALAILQKYNAKATLFVINSVIGTPGYLTWEELDSIMESGLFTLGSHSYNLHGWVDYTMLPDGGYISKLHHLREETWDEYLNRVRQDLQQSRNELYERYQQPILFFAYPFGEYTAQSIKRVQECGFLGAFTFNKSECYVTHSTHPYAMDRLPVFENSNLQDLLLDTG
jgi:peptidoglycan/xylan/chitin deacetylase (PgdA/CDA1 family)